MDTAYLQTTVSPALTQALASLVRMLSATHPARHPVVDPIEYIGRFLLHSLEPVDVRDEEQRAAVRNERLAAERTRSLEAKQAPAPDEIAEHTPGDGAAQEQISPESQQALAGGSDKPGSAEEQPQSSEVTAAAPVDNEAPPSDAAADGAPEDGDPSVNNTGDDETAAVVNADAAESGEGEPLPAPSGDDPSPPPQQPDGENETATEDT
ncbi:hypothetical protein RI367_002456 [Sorochytrium milnesiophthora]